MIRCPVTKFGFRESLSQSTKKVMNFRLRVPDIFDWYTGRLVPVIAVRARKRLFPHEPVVFYSGLE